ncbi:MAG: hypothetical protein MHPSP_000268 [Paramarteilia canceri]
MSPAAEVSEISPLLVKLNGDEEYLVSLSDILLCHDEEDLNKLGLRLASPHIVIIRLLEFYRTLKSFIDS